MLPSLAIAIIGRLALSMTYEPHGILGSLTLADTELYPETGAKITPSVAPELVVNTASSGRVIICL